MRKSKKSKVGMMISILLVVAFIAGCAGSTEADQNSSDKTINRVTYALASDIGTTEPYNGLDADSYLFQVFSPLTRPDKDGNVVGDLAETFSAVDSVTWEFKLRQNVKFHNGEAFNADAVKFSIDRLLNPEYNFGFAADYELIKEVKAIDEFTVHIVTKEPFNLLPLRLLYLSIVPPKYIEEHGNEYFAEHPVGTGPFEFKEYVKDDHVTLTAYQDYYNGAPAIDELIFKPIPEEASRIAALEAGEVDLIQGVSSSQIERLEKNEKLEVVSFPTTRSIYIGFDTVNNPVTKNKAFRQALNYAVDVDSIIENVLDGKANRLATVFLSHFKGYTDEVTPYPHDTAKAKELLKEAGYNNEPLTVVAPTGINNSKEVAEAVANQLREVGVSVTVVQKEYGLFREEIAAGQPDPLFLFGFGGAFNSAEQISRVGFGSGQRISAYANPELDELRVKAAAAVEDAEADALWKEFQIKFHEEAPAIFLYQQYSTAVYNKKLVGWQPRKDEMILFDGASLATAE